MRGAGRVLFAAIFLLIVGTLNIIYGIGAIADANFYANDTRYILTNLNALGWALIILGVIQLTGGFSLMAGRVWGRLVGIVGGSLGSGSSGGSSSTARITTGTSTGAGQVQGSDPLHEPGRGISRAGLAVIHLMQFEELPRLLL
jgi:hypothetical protein